MSMRERLNSSVMVSASRLAACAQLEIAAGRFIRVRITAFLAASMQNLYGCSNGQDQIVLGHAGISDA